MSGSVEQANGASGSGKNPTGEPLFSVVVAAYNVEEYISEAVDSLLAQDIGLEKLQIVLVDDGSVDSTGEICSEYQARYPENIVAIRQPNGGASAARRRGLREARGKYVNFLDGDDKWSEDAFSAAAAFFKQHPGVEIATAKHRFFGAREGEHPLGYKFDLTRVIDLGKAVDYPQLSLSNAFVRRELLDEGLFDDRLKVSEDFLVVNRILLELSRYGVISGPTYWYRKRDGEDSAIDSSHQSTSWYFDPPRYCYQALFDEADEKLGAVPRWLQFSVMYDMQWRIKNRFLHPLSDGELEDYRGLIRGLLLRIDDDVIASQRNMSTTQKIYTLSLKHGMEFDRASERLQVIRYRLYWDSPSGESVFLASASSEKKLVIEHITREDGGVRFEMRYDSSLPPEMVELHVIGKGRAKTVKAAPDPCRTQSSFFSLDYACGLKFDFTVPAEDVKFRLSLACHTVVPELHAGGRCSFSMRENFYAKLGDRCVVVRKGKKDQLAIRRTSPLFELKREVRWAQRVWKNGPDARRHLVLRERSLGKMKERHSGERVWLISDRPTMAGDNGEALFAYLHDHPVEGVRPYFVLNADSPDFARMREYGPVVEFGSRRHRRLHAVADKVISSAADVFVYDRFGRYKYVFAGFGNPDFVFLQHGVTKDDMSHWLAEPKKDIRMFVTAAQAEYDSIVSTPRYGYGPDVVKLTGFPRHDRLLRQAAGTTAERRVTIAPTWRESIAGKVDPATGKRASNPAFAGSDYFRFYNSLINDGRLREAAGDLGYAVDFLIHPALAQEAPLFRSDFCNVLEEYRYTDMFLRTAVLVTDFSSIAFDFALLRKPIVYSQFDRDSFYSSHAWERGYFSYEEHGFGEVCPDLDSAVGAIVTYMEDPAMPAEYAARVDSFFGEQPSDRCGEVVRAILEIDDRPRV